MVDKGIIQFLSQLGISHESALVYLSLVGKPAQTAQKIARTVSIPKTTVYRRLEELKRNGLVEEQIEEYKRVFAITSVDLLNRLIIEKEQETKELQAQFPHIKNILLGQLQSFDPETKVLFYRGRDRIRQMLWNILSTKTALVGYTYRDITPFVGKKFAEDWNKEFALIHQKARDLYSDEYIRSKLEGEKSHEKIWKGWESRYIAPEILAIQHQLDVYNNVVCLYNWHGNDVFGVEIYNDKVANFQRQIFEVMWQKGKFEPVRFMIDRVDRSKNK